MLVLAFQADLTRVITFRWPNERQQSLVPDDRRSQTGTTRFPHHQNDKKKQEKIQRSTAFHIEQLAYLLGKLKSVKEGERPCSIR